MPIKSKNIEDQLRGLNDLNKTNQTLNDTLKDLKENIHSLYAEMAKGTKITEENNAVSDKERKKREADAEAWYKDTEALKKYTGAAAKTTNVLQGFGILKDMWKSPAKNIAGQAKAWGNYAEKMKEVGRDSKDLAGAMTAAGKMTIMMGEAVGGVAEALAGWPGLVLMGFKAVFEVVNSLDGYVKKLNKSFAYIRGPSLTTDVNKQFKDFNTAITSVFDNLRDGLTSKEVYGFLEGMNSMGVSVSSLNTEFQSYRDVVHVAAKANKIFGGDMVNMAQYQSKMMLDYRMDLKEIDSAFVQVAFDAEKSGLSTDKFWNSVLNASNSLAFYGKFLSSTSTLMSKFSSSGLMSADAAAKATEEIQNFFNKMTDTERLGVVQLGKQYGVKWPEIGKEIAKGLQSDVGDIQKQINLAKAKQTQEFNETGEENPETTKLLEDLNNKFSAANQKLDRIKNTGTSDLALAQDLPMYSDKTLDVLSQIISGMDKQAKGTGILAKSGQDLITAVQGIHAMPGGANISEETIRYVIETTKQALYGIEDGLKDALKNIKAGGPEESTKILDEINNRIEKMVWTGEEGQKNLEEEGKFFSKELHISSIQAKNLIKGLVVNKKLLSQFKLGLKDGNMNSDQLYDVLDKLINTDEEGLAVNHSTLKTGVQDAKTQKKQYDKTYREVTAQTLSLQDAMTIAQDAAKWQGAVFFKVAKISEWIGRIANKYLKEEITTEQKEAQKILDKAGYAGRTDYPQMLKELKDKQDTDQKQLDTAEDSKTLLKSIVDVNGNIDTNKLNSTLSDLKTNPEDNKEQIQLLQGILKAGGNTTDRQLMKKQYDVSTKYAILNSTNATKALNNDQDQINAINSVDSHAEDIVDLLGSQASQDPDAGGKMLEYIKQRAEAAGENTITPEDLFKYGGNVGGQIASDYAKKNKLFSPGFEYAPALMTGLAEALLPLVGPALMTGLVGGFLTLGGPQKIVPHMSTVPGHASGTSFAHGGMTLVGEKGPELVNMKRGAQIFDSAQTRRLAPVLGSTNQNQMPAPTSNKNIVVNVTATEKNLGDRIANQVRSVLYAEYLR